MSTARSLTRNPTSVVIAVALAVGLVGWMTSPASGGEVNFAGTAQLDYLFVVTSDEVRDLTLDGFTTELSLKIDVDATDHLSFSVKTCYGCHGFEIGMAYADWRIADALTLRAGRFSPAFGDFPDRHDPANHSTSDKPLPYDMGRMLRLRDWNMSVLPAPYVDNGIQLHGTLELGEYVEIDYAAFAIGGLRGGADAVDVDFIQMRTAALYYVDNNSQPSGGGRLAFGFRLGDLGSLRLGASALYGTYDPDNELDLLILGADLVLRLERWTLRAEYLVRRTKMHLGDDPASAFRYGPGDDGSYDPYSLKEGWYVETEYPVFGGLTVLARWDGMRRRGNVATTQTLRSDTAVFRYTLALAYTIVRQARVKVSGEFYDFSDFQDEGAIHVGFVGAF